MEPTLDDRNEPLANGLHRDRDGYDALFPSGVGPRRNPNGDFPTGPPIGARFPDVVAADHTGRMLDVHEHRGDDPLVFVFFRSAVW